ncbi:MAG TPA: sigma-70 family RNA polymerase sigma factor [Acidimicrobiales bacterium]|jgi:RNA polymerase sigma-70 factor (ECF subfamily)
MDDGTGEFDSLFRTLFVPAYQLALRLLGDPHDAQDAASEAMARALADWRRVSELPHLRPWVLRVTANVSVDMLRRRKATPDTDWVSEALAPMVAGADEPDVRMALTAALGRLPRRQLEVVVLRYLIDLPEEEVAASLGIAPGTVKRHASRGLERLRRTLRAHGLTKEARFAY